ncbi:hypothetical protein [Candidatus Albibeggiatoa sp. nov. NOAA]|uniref:leucine-rich repeat domain-containing protein n=1 Tax=Candidatus Albibeggiatoa sp. nov. NOAA TaxID=3162724 RepID=UPI0033055B1B|nr:leucine-rich repeat domain-containing protein [Thiotrichaceae bacterium]
MTPNLLTEQLLSFLTGLRQEGYIIGVGQLVAVEHLIFALAERGELPENPRDLKTYIAPLICQSPEEQVDFYQRFEYFVLPAAETQAHLSEHTEQVIEKFQWRNMLWKNSFWLILIVLLLVVGNVYKQEILDFFSSQQQTEQVDSPQQPAQPQTIQEPVIPQDPVQQAKPDEPKPDLNKNKDESHSTTIPSWVYFVVGLLPLLWWLWRRNQQAFLRRQLPTSPPDIKQLFVQHIKADLFSTVKLARSSQQLRKHIDVPSTRLDMDASLQATLNNSGFFVPIYTTRKQSPEYLILVDRATFKDHHSLLVDELLDHLHEEGVYFKRFYFDTDPRRCYAENDGQPLSLQILASRYPEHRLLMFSDAQGLIEPLTGQLANWVRQLFDWEQRSVLMFSSEAHLQNRQQLLQGVDFMVVPASAQGLAALAAQWQAEPISLQAAELQRYPRYLLMRPRRVLERHPLDKDELAQLMAQLKQYLDEDGLLWLAACAIYPEVKWQLTVYLGQQLDVLSAERLGQLAKLPWLRYGYMPDWLRQALIAHLSKQQDQQIREVLATLLTQAIDQSEFDFKVALPKGTVATVQWMLKRWVKQVDSLDGLRDTVFVSFMQNKLSVRLPRVWQRFMKVKRSYRVYAAAASVVLGIWLGFSFLQSSGINQADLNALRQLEQEIGIKLEQVDLEAISSTDSDIRKNGYAMGENNRVIIGLNLDDSKLSAISDNIISLKKLQKLSLIGTKIEKIPDSLTQLQNLNYLDLSSTQITQLPAPLLELKNLQRLNLDSNKITQLPKEILNLNLEILWETGYIRKGIAVGDNPLTSPPPEIIQQGQEAIRQYFGVDASNNKAKQNTADLQIIKQLEQEIGQKLAQVKIDEVDIDFINRENGYAVDQNNNVIGLSLSQLKLAQIPNAVLLLKNLQKLSIIGNDIEILPTSFGQLQNLTYLDLSFNQLKKLPASFGQLQNLSSLFLNKNPLQALPTSFKQLQSLNTLGLAYTQLKALPTWFGQLQNLTSLDFGGNPIQELPESFAQLQNLTELALNDNQLKELPASFGQLKNLTTLMLVDTQLTTLPASFAQLQNLKILGLGNNPLQELPESLGQLQNLNSLDLSNIQLKVLPDWLGQLQNLTELSVTGMPLQALPAWLLQLQKLEELRLDNTQLTTLPTWFGKLQSLTTLDLSENALQTLPTEFSQLQKLDVLLLNDNQLQTLPESFGQLQRLRELYLNNNRLQKLPTSFGQLQSLRSLNLSNTQLKQLPAPLKQLQNLGILYLMNNQLKELPVWLGQLQKLNKLVLDHNQLTELPAWVWELDFLKDLRLSSNKITVLPKEILNLNVEIKWDNPSSSYARNKGIYVKDNPLTSPPPEVIQQGQEAIRDYFAEAKQDLKK